jgi:hypothetical protein
MMLVLRGDGANQGPAILAALFYDVVTKPHRPLQRATPDG